MCATVVNVCRTASTRQGKTKATSFSLDAATLERLKALAAPRQKGTVSAMLAEIAAREVKLTNFARLSTFANGIPFAVA